MFHRLAEAEVGGEGEGREQLGEGHAFIGLACVHALKRNHNLRCGQCVPKTASAACAEYFSADLGSFGRSVRMITELRRLIYLGRTYLFAAIRLLAAAAQTRMWESWCCATNSRYRYLRAVRRSWIARTGACWLVYRMPRTGLRKLHLLVSPDTVLRWHRGADCRPARPEAAPGSGVPAGCKALLGEQVPA